MSEISFLGKVHVDFLVFILMTDDIKKQTNRKLFPVLKFM